MLVRDIMTRTPVTITPDTPVSDALRLMREKKVRRLPVLDAQGKLAGIVSQKDLLYVSPSPATTLAVWEISELLSKVTVEKVMTKDVITVEEETALEEAARIMVDQRVGGLPVMKGAELVGIITETDLFKNLVRQLGGRRPGVRLTAVLPDQKGALAGVTQAIFNAGGDIVGVGLAEITAEGGSRLEMMVKVQGVAREALVEAVRPTVTEIIDVREM